MIVLGGAYRALHFAVRARVVARYLGVVLVALAALSSVPAAVALFSGRSDIAIRYGVVIAVLSAAGAAGARIRSTERMQPNEAMVVTALAFVVAGLASAVPMMGYGIAPIDAIFEAISGVTTTGLSSLGTISEMPRTFLFGRAWLQWIGGLGVVVLVLAFVVPSGLAAKRLGFDEREAVDYAGSTRAHARRIFLIYTTLTAIGVVLAAASGLDPFDAVSLTLSAISTGGFATSDSSLIGLGAASQAVIGLVCLAGAVTLASFQLQRLSSLARDRGVRALLLGSFAGAILLGLFGMPDSGESAAIGWDRIFWMSVSAQTTAGFSTLTADSLAPAGKLVLSLQMLIGGDLGSTAGGLKLLRILILGKLLWAALIRSSLPISTHWAVRVHGDRVDRPELEAVATLAIAYVVALVASWFAFLVAGYEPIDSLFEVASALGTAGLSVGISSPDLEPWLKGVLCLDMLLGRVEIFAFVVLFFPGTWIGRRRSSL